VNACHAKGIAVILDAVYAHAHPEFPYNLVYEATGEPNPMMGYFQGEFFSRPGMDYGKSFTRDYVLAVNRHWLDEYHLDGFRYDYVPGFYDGPMGAGYARLVYDTYGLSQGTPRFLGPGNRSLIIQCAEHLPDPQGILAQTYSNTCWQNGLLDRAIEVAWGGSFAGFAHQLDPEFIGYPAEYRNPNGDTHPVAPFQYLETHDHSRLISRIAPGNVRDLLDQPYGDRGRFYRLQPSRDRALCRKRHSDALAWPGIRRELERSARGTGPQPPRTAAALGILLRSARQSADPAPSHHGRVAPAETLLHQPRLFLLLR